MRPMLLTLQGIGPYGGRQIVDFRGVIDAGLFGIYGATGSGKSTIFSGMTFALFGEAARGEQHATTLRSDYADPQTLSHVELVFEAGARIYRIVRQPEQTRPAKRGGGEVKEAHKAWLFDVTGLKLDSVGPQNPGRVIAETKVKLVDDAVKALLGYGVAQFRQIVLLPQGRFEAFLAAGSDERMAILRELFDVSLFRRLAENLKAEADTAGKAVIQSRAVAKARLAAEGFDSLAALSEGLADSEHRYRDLSELEKRAKEFLQAATEAKASALAAHAAFKEFQSAEAECAEFVNLQPAIDEAARRLARARTAQSLLDVAEARETARRDVIEADQRLSDVQKQLQSHQSRVLQAKKELDALLSQAGFVETQKAQLVVYQGYAMQLKESARLDVEAREAQKAASAQVGQSKDSQRKYDELAGLREKAAQDLESAFHREARRAQVLLSLTEVRQRLGSAQDFEAAQERLANCQSALSGAERRLKEAIEARTAAETAAAEVEAALLKDRAAHLALHLKTGAPCPVCGSAEHPAPAHGGAEDAGDDKAYSRAKSSCDEARKLAEDALVQFEKARQALEDRRAELARLAVPPASVAVVAAELNQLEAALKALGPQLDVASLKDSLSNHELQMAEAKSAFESARESAEIASLKAAEAEQALQSTLALVPADLRSQQSLKVATDVLRESVIAFERNSKAAAAADLAAVEDLASSRQALETATAELERLRKRQSAEEHRFAARLAESDLNEPAFEEDKRAIGSISELEKYLSEKSEKRAAAEIRLERARAAIANLDRPDVAAKEAAWAEAAAALERAQAETVKAAVRLESLQKLRSELEREAERLDLQEKEMAPLVELAEAFSGRSYHQVPLETFAISALFDQVLEAANLRLGPMTRQRYSLVRDVGGSGRARRGLGIVVEDAYTGRQRPTSTLSGGETFIAALSLALGLSDVVESAHGSVRLDTIFIDEGFGSLDSESDGGTLETVMQTLQDMVGANRAVGLISHVPLVQQVVPNGFFVTKTPGGSRIEVRG